MSLVVYCHGRLKTIDWLMARIMARSLQIGLPDPLFNARHSGLKYIKSPHHARWAARRRTTRPGTGTIVVRATEKGPESCQCMSTPPTTTIFDGRKTALRARFDSELTLIIQLMLYKFSLWSLGTSYGARLQGLTYTVQRGPSGPVSHTRTSSLHT